MRFKNLACEVLDNWIYFHSSHQFSESIEIDFFNDVEGCCRFFKIYDYCSFPKDENIPKFENKDEIYKSGSSLVTIIVFIIYSSIKGENCRYISVDFFLLIPWGRHGPMAPTPLGETNIEIPLILGRTFFKQKTFF